MAGMIRKNLDSPEETRPFEEGMGHVEMVNLDAGPVGRGTFNPVSDRSSGMTVTARQNDAREEPSA